MYVTGQSIIILVSEELSEEQPGKIGPESQSDVLVAVATVIYCSCITINTFGPTW